MPNIPGLMYRLPSCDSTYRCDIAKDGVVILETDNHGLMFNVVGDKFSVANKLLEDVLYRNSWLITKNCLMNASAISFKFQDHKLVEVFPRNRPEDRPQVLEIVSILKTMISLKVYW